MLKIFNARQYGLAVLITVVAVVPALAEDTPDLSALPRYETLIPYNGVRNWHVTQNLGPTGMRGWVYGHRSHTRDSRELLVKSVEPGSPADGIMQTYDIIVGAAVPPDTPSTQWTTAPTVRAFDSDARLALARAITWAESDAGKGELKLLRQRKGKVETVVIKLPVMGTYSATAPSDCPKTKRIVENAARLLAENTPANGGFDLTGAMNALFLYATGDDRYLDHVRRTAMRMSVNHTINDAGHESWRWGYQNMFLAEYYLATGDKRVLPTIQEYSQKMAAGQCNPGTWGHRMVPDFVPPGYGSMNQAGLICFMSMVLAEQAGVEVDTQAMRNSIEFYGSYAGTGGIPYGDHPPHADPTCNGKNGSAAVVFGLLGAVPAEQWFARMCASTVLGSFEGGHTGNFFNQTWSPLGAALAGRNNYQAFWSRFNSYRDLARRWDGGFVTQPLPNTREGDLGTGNYVRKGPMWSTGGFAISYLAGNKTLGILGRRDSVFAANPPAELEAALDLYHRKQFEQCANAAAGFVDASDARLRRLAKQLQTAAERNINSRDLTLKDMAATLEAGDLYKLKWQLQAIESIVDAADPRLAKFRAAVDDPANAEVIAAGEAYHRSIGGPVWSGLHGFQFFARSVQTNGRSRGALEQLAEKGPVGYSELAKAYLEKYPHIEVALETRLFDAAASWRLRSADQPLGDDWASPEFDDTDWQAITLPSQAVVGKGERYLRVTFDGVDASSIAMLGIEYSVKGKMTAYLNGEKIIEGVDMGWFNPVIMPLKPATLELLKAEGNVLAVKLTPAKGDEQFRVALVARMK